MEIHIVMNGDSPIAAFENVFIADIFMHDVHLATGIKNLRVVSTHVYKRA